jgi:hypothetical protein
MDLGVQRESDDAAVSGRHRLHDVADPCGGVLDCSSPDGASCVDQSVDVLPEEWMLSDHRECHRGPNHHEIVSHLDLIQGRDACDID